MFAIRNSPLTCFVTLPSFEKLDNIQFKLLGNLGSLTKMRTARQSVCKLQRYFCRRLSQISFREPTI